MSMVTAGMECNYNISESINGMIQTFTSSGFIDWFYYRTFEVLDFKQIQLQ